MPTILITGANGFVGKNLQLHLSERKDVQVRCFTRANTVDELPALLNGADFVFHLAGVNRPQDPAAFVVGNAGLTQALCTALAQVATTTGRKVPVVFASSIQAAQDNAYGQSKRAAEDALFALQHEYGVPVHVFRLPNVFGKWARPNYNSAVATFCHNTARGLPITVNDPAASLTLVYVDDVVQRFIHLLDGADAALDAAGFATVAPQYSTTVGALAAQIQAFKESRNNLVTERVGTGLVRALYSTYVSYLPVEEFAYTVPQHGDARGVFVEMLKTPDCGQFSYFTAHPGITRGGHYHHSKTEKFLVIKGCARFKFRHMHTGETHTLDTSGEQAQVVETVPGWTHDITNIGSDELVVMLWANEIFDRERPDTFACPVEGNK
ncbi:MAG: capsular polysaccharide biosynthesis protein CapF [Comamonas sp.]|nr:capsular polysaccharide biosynthesis protein CapF [Comamonas sp.]